MDYLCKFLSLDLCDVLNFIFTGSTACGCCHCTARYQKQLKYEAMQNKLKYAEIANEFPKPLVTYDGKKEGKLRLVRISDLTDSVIDLILEQTKEQIRKEEEFKQSSTKYNRSVKCTPECLEFAEECGRLIYECYGTHMRGLKSWDQLKPLEKLCHYWLALTGYALKSTPYANFETAFTLRFQRMYPKKSLKSVSSLAMRHWRKLKTEQRVPFTLHALLYHIGNGCIDPHNDEAVARILDRLSVE